jgi:predicted unusual protein kinase regulating ubiquinone biosynthesis (AarF/ABC1/UbiB family)
MALIAVSTDDSSGVARIFFDLGAAGPTREDEHRIALAIEQAFANRAQQARQGSGAASASTYGRE